MTRRKNSRVKRRQLERREIKKSYGGLIIPSRVIDHWRNVWEWSDEKINEAIIRFARGRGEKSV